MTDREKREAIQVKLDDLLCICSFPYEVWGDFSGTEYRFHGSNVRLVTELYEMGCCVSFVSEDGETIKYGGSDRHSVTIRKSSAFVEIGYLPQWSKEAEALTVDLVRV